ncbi:MAG: glycosyltransferase family 39 protein [Anaerolineae bacterium]|nr:glycosyltransferase family 39 protein [Anaerolineae bacterium]
MTTTQRYFWLFVLCLLGYFLMRLPNLLALPAHVDEGDSLLWAQLAQQGHPLRMVEKGKVLIMAFTALIGPFSGGLFVARFMVLLTGVVGLAAIYACARKMHSPQAGLLAALLWLGTPQLIFFERISLHDIPMTSMAVLTFWLALRVIEKADWRRALWCGLGLMLCIAAKATGIIFLIIPAIVWLCWRTQLPARDRLRQLALTYFFFVLLMLIPVLYLVGVHADPLHMGANQPANLSTLFDAGGLAERVRVNLIRMIQAERNYLTIFPLLLIPLGAFILIRRNIRLLINLTLTITAILLAVALLASKLWLRYVIPITPFLWLLIAVGAAYWLAGYRGRRPSPLLRRAAWIAILSWLMVVGVPYAVTAQRDPTALDMPDTDRLEYVTWIASGYGMRDAVEYLAALPTAPITAIGTAGDCYGGRAMLRLESVTLICPTDDLWWDDANTAYVQSIHERAAKDGYVLIVADETAPIIAPERLPQPLRTIRVFPRPGGAYNIILYCAGADPDHHCPQP